MTDVRDFTVLSKEELSAQISQAGPGSKCLRVSRTFCVKSHLEKSTGPFSARKKS